MQVRYQAAPRPDSLCAFEKLKRNLSGLAVAKSTPAFVRNKHCLGISAMNSSAVLFLSVFPFQFYDDVGQVSTGVSPG
jgi:hypothetical protein